MDNKASILIQKYLEGKCTPEERATLLAHFNQYLDANRQHLSPEEIQQLSEITWDAIKEDIGLYPKEKPVVALWRRWVSYAVAVVVLLVGGWLFMQREVSDVSIPTAGSDQDIFPQGDRAVLTLADGRTIDLDTQQSGIVFSDHIAYQDGSAVHGEKLSADQHYQLATPIGATYSVTLPDGTKVWLNGDSEIKYPGQFHKTKRVVKVKGEAYFDVVNEHNVPFIVVTQGQEIQVLGTEFNISAYSESIVKTTLVEGSVQIVTPSNSRSPLLLSPGEQAILTTDGALNKKKANLKKELAWKSGIFYFDQTPVSKMIQEVVQWYGVEARYESGIPKGTFSGVMDRNVSLRTLLEFLEESSPQFNFELSNELLIVRPKKQ